jgi:tetratricopeptide (TPR) repeat protein
MSSSGILKVILVVVGLAVIGGLVYYFVLNPGNKYDRLIKNADEHFQEQQYQEAKKLYSEAVSIRSDELYPKEQLFAIDSIQRKLEVDIKYDEKVQKADLLYSNGEYLEASQYYFDALNVKPDEAYPVDQIKKIQELIKDPDYEKKQKELAASKTKTPPAATPKKEQPKATQQPKPKPQPASQQPMKTIADGKYFHVIVGVFDDHNNAVKMRDKMIEMGKESMIIQRPGNLEAVTFGSYDKLNTAFNFLEFVRNDINADAWVLYHETK